jgi:hypothetical protein
VLEEELDLQLALLKEHNSIADVSLFPIDTVEDKILSRLHDARDLTNNDIDDPNVGLESTTSQSATHEAGFFHQPTPVEIFAMEETILEKNLLEPIAICLVIAGLALVPQFI